MEDESGIGQLLAFVDSIDMDLLESVEIGDMDTSSTVSWACPPFYIDRFPNKYSELIHSAAVEGGYAHMDQHSPASPVRKARTALFGGSEGPVDIDLCGDNTDPRSVCVVDHPGRYSQFKHWAQLGLTIDENRRVTQKEDSSRANCLAAEAEFRQSSKPTLEPDLLEILLLQRSPAPHATTSPRRDSVGEFKQDDESACSMLENSTRGVTSSCESWKDKCFLLGQQLIVSMSDSDLTTDSFPAWCLWFNDRLCFWGLSDRVAVSGSGSNASPAYAHADIDFSRNRIGDFSVRELLTLLDAFRRIKVKTLRLSSTGLTDNGLIQISTLPYLQHLVIDCNEVTTAGILSFTGKHLNSKKDHYEVLRAQDSPEAGILDPVFVNLEANRIRNALSLADEFAAAFEGVCVSDSTGCQPLGRCRVYGDQCQMHIYGVGCQRSDAESSY